MAWFDEFNLPGATIDGYFGFIKADGQDEDDYPDVVLADGTVTFTATTEAARIDGAWLGIQPVTAQIFEGKIVISEEDPRPVRLLATDAPIGVADWAWRASFNVPGFRLNDLTFRAPRDTTVNLTADMIPIKSQPYQIIEGASIVDAEVSGEGTMRFELSDGSYTSWMDVPNGERGITGAPGEKGDRGADGTAATLAMGSVSAGSTADAWMTGTPLARELHLTLPRGQKGDKGDPGSKGDPGDPATPVSATATATEGAQWDVDVTFAGGALDFDFTVPPGGTAFWKGTLDNSVDLDAATTPGMYGVWASSPNAPGSGVLQVSEVRTTSGTVSQVNHTFFQTGSFPQILTRFRGASGGWSGWSWIAGKDSLRLQQFGATGDLNDATTPGFYSYWSGTGNAPGGSGLAVVSELASTSGAVSQVVQIAYTSGSTPSVHMRFRGSSAWSGWTRVDAGAVVPAPSSGGSGSALKRVPLVLTAATASGEDTAGRGAIRFPIHYGATITRWRLHVRNHNYASGVSYTSGGRVSGVWLGTGWDGAFDAAPTQVVWPFDIPTDGSEVVTPWINTPLNAGVQQMLSVGWTASTSSPKVRPAGGVWVSTSSASASAQSGTGYTVSNWVPFDWWIEAETSPSTPTIAGYGDSITAGTGTSLILNDSWLSQYARSIGALPVHWAYPGSGMVLWTNSADQKWQRWQDFPPADAVIHAMGQNDLGSAESAQVMRDRFEATLPLIRAHISPTVAVSTITPHAGKTEAQNTVRREHAAWLRTLPHGVIDLFDFAAAVSNDDTALRPEYRGGAGTDELHPNTAGAGAMAGAINRPVVATPARDALTAYLAEIGA